MEIKTKQELLDLLINENDVIRKARIVSQLRSDNKVSLQEIAKSLNKHVSYISHIVRILKIPQLVIDAYYSGQISATHLMIISRLQSDKQMVEAHEEILRNNLTVLETEMLIRKLKYDVETDSEALSSDELVLKSKSIQNKLEARVVFYQSRVKGKIILEKRGKTKDTSAFLKKIYELLNNSSSDGDSIQTLD